MRRTKHLLCACIGALLVLCLSACSAAEKPTANSSQAAPTATDVRVAALKGPTAMGLAGFINKAETNASSLQNNYSFEVLGTADEVLPRLIRGELDFALLPANVAALANAKTEGELRVVNINTLGVLYLVSGDANIQGLDSLQGKTVLMTGKGATPEYVMNYLLQEKGLSDVTLEYKSEASEVAALLASNPQAVAVLPQPYATSVCVQNESLHICGSLTEEWDALQENTPEAQRSMMVTGVTVVRKAFLEEHPEAVAEFMAQQAESVAFANENPDQAAELIVDLGIVGNAAIAQQVIPYCNIVFIANNQMKSALEGYYQVLASSNPASIGGALPASEFYALGLS